MWLKKSCGFHMYVKERNDCIEQQTTKQKCNARGYIATGNMKGWAGWVYFEQKLKL